MSENVIPIVHVDIALYLITIASRADTKPEAVIQVSKYEGSINDLNS